jgi:gliding motility-associated-like protein
MQDVKCFGGKDGSATILVTGGTKPYSYSWNNYTTGATNTKLSIGKYTVYVSDANGCWLTDSLKISEPTLLEVEANEKAKTCFGFSNGSASATAKGGMPPYSYLWNTVPQQTGTNAQNLLGGLYIVTVIDSNGCTQDDTVDVGNFPNPKVVVNDVNAICFGKQTELNASGTHTYKWSPSQTLLCDSCSTTIAYPKSTTEYRVIGTDINGCADTTFVTVNVIPKKEVSVGANLNICFGEEATLSANGGERYQWYPNIPFSNQHSSNPMVKPDTTITYTVIITENECFTDTLKQKVTVHPQPIINLGPDLKGTPGSTIQLKADMSFADKIMWTPETGLSCYDCLQPLVYLSRTITYIATAYSDYCKAMDDITIRVACDEALFFIPNTFTPNGDGANDRFYPSATGVSKIDIFRVYNRWGEKIFEARDFAPNKEEYGWDGKDKNQPLTPDVYVYYLESRCANGEKIFLKGDISLIR